jgi:DNA sulfur modification protein DndB
MATYVPAIRARLGDLEYFVSVVTFGEAARLVEYVEQTDAWTSETPAELKLQRKLNLPRVEREMVPYLLADQDHFYSALTVEIRPAPYAGGLGAVTFEPKQTFPGGLEFGVLTLDGTECLYALDGQHRLKSIELAIRQKPELAREHITLILVPFKSIARSQTLFSDLNRYAKGPSRSIAILFTHRESLARIAKALAHGVPLLRDRVNMESTSLSSNSRQFITLSTLYEMTRTLVGRDLPNDDPNEKQYVSDLSDIWSALSNTIGEWQTVVEGREHPAYLRQRYLNMHGVAQQAIAVAVATARRAEGNNWRDILTRFSEVDWRLINPEWEGVALHGGRVNNTTTSVRLLADALQRKLGVGAEAVKAV